MQTEKTVQSNGGDILPIESGEYYFDAVELTATLPWGDDKELVVVYSKPETEDHIDYEKAVQWKTVIVDGVSRDQGNPEPANREFFDRLVARAELRRKGVREPIRTFDREQCIGSFAPETKTKVVAAMGASTFEMIADDEFGGLLEKEGSLRVKQTLPDGEREIIYEINPLSKDNRRDFADGLQVGQKFKNRRIERTTESSLLKKGMKHFRDKLLSVDGGRIQAGPFSAELREEYIKQIDVSWQMVVIDTICSYYGNAPK